MQVTEGFYYLRGRCFRVVKLFDDCDVRRKVLSYEAARLYRNGRWLGDCTIMYETVPELCTQQSS